MKRLFICLALAAASVGMAWAKPVELKSPDGKLTITVDNQPVLAFSVNALGKDLVKDCQIGLTLSDRVCGLAETKGMSAKQTKVDETIKPVVPLKFSTIPQRYNQLTLSFRGGYAVEFRAYDDGAAYRFVLAGKEGDTVDVMDETMKFALGGDYLLHLQQPSGFKTSNEETYTHIQASQWKPADRMASLPLLADCGDGHKMLISESDLRDYPGLMFRGEGGGMSAIFPACPVKFADHTDRSVHIVEEAPYIARTSARRTFPWRYFFVAEKDVQLTECTMTVRLAQPCCLEETAWITPGRVSWEWWNGATPYGPDVDFKAGCTLDTYKYYVDFASKYGLEYILLDEGWAASTRDPFTPNPQMDLHELISYAKGKNVKIMLWLTWLTVENNFGLFKTFEEWGVSAVKIDFMDRSDQWMVNFYERVVKEAAKHHLAVDFHGAYKPSGLEVTYPNLLSYEGVRGLEYMGGCEPANSIYYPYLRNAVGPMDYTPGAMISMQPESYVSRRPNSAAKGTRAYQLANFVVFESGVQMLADSPTNYYNNPSCTSFMASVPVTWDETRGLRGVAGEYVVIAKRKGNDWFLGAMTAEKEQEISLPLDFLGEGAYEMTCFADGPNAGYQAMDFTEARGQVSKGQTLKLRLARNGGFAAKFSK